MPMTTGVTMPVRSVMRPRTIPPAPNPSMVSVYAREASPRATPNSVCTAGSATMTDHIPTPPMVDSNNASTSRVHAYEESTPSRATRPVIFFSFATALDCASTIWHLTGVAPQGAEQYVTNLLQPVMDYLRYRGSVMH